MVRKFARRSLTYSGFTLAAAVGALLYIPNAAGWLFYIAGLYFVALAVIYALKADDHKRRYKAFLNAGNIERALEFLQIDAPVEFHFVPPTLFREQDLAGWYQYENGVHNVYINNELSTWEQSKTVWHELSHAHQFEHDFDGDGSAFHHEAWARAIQKQLDGTDDPFELEAEKMELMSYPIPLVVRH
jgi:hypothetical protein